MKQTFFSQSIFNQINGARLSGLANMGVSVSGPDSWSFNPAILGEDPKNFISLSGESRFVGTGIRGSAFSSSMAMNSKSGLGLSAEFYGLPEYYQLGFKLGYGRLLSRTFSIGSSIQHVLFYNIRDDPASLNVLAIGGLFMFNAQVSIGAAYRIPFSFLPYKMDYYSPGFELGCKYSLSSQVQIYTELSNEHSFGLSIKVACEYQVMHSFTLRLAVSTLPQLFSTGVSFKLSDRLRIDAASLFYQGIGITPAISLVYIFESPKKEKE